MTTLVSINYFFKFNTLAGDSLSRQKRKRKKKTDFFGYNIVRYQNHAGTPRVPTWFWQKKRDGF